MFAPFAAWFTAGSLKLAISVLRSGRIDWEQVGLGGLPSNHTAMEIAIRSTSSSVMSSPVRS
jgi:acid phosphatase family membrane protein YuiD